MKSSKIKEMMVPLSDYATVSKDASLFDAVRAHEAAQEAFDPSKYRHRAILVLDDDGAVIGKISQLDILRALEPQYEEMLDRNGMARYGFTRSFMKSILEQFRLWSEPLIDICNKAVKKPVHRFMYTPDAREIINEDASLDEAIHQMLMGNYQSLLVTRNGRITGILRLTDVFDTISAVMNRCGIS